ncbi:DegV domain-containing protein [Caloramator mitchellensis]|uniref:DegV domain-containing protein n=1 Tax=Caloramator mitchellensis TaxID=908809 RepID=A0A0R3JZW2_CALMK|nr:DegV family protein [Caloramator mitchellensis]KRQ86798.1 DegV domain-containing protein [Caloramator mitchellensis]
MEKIALLTDSSCDIPKDLLNKFGINVVSLRIIYNDKEYRDGVDITPQEIYSNLDSEIPKTSMPSPSDVLNKFNELKEKGFTHCIAITISSGLSGTYDMFKLIEKEIEDLKISVIDSKILSTGLGHLVLEAAKLVSQNVNFEKIVEILENLRHKTKGFFIVDTLEYLKKGGRISSFSAKIGSLLNIKPVISIDELGKYFMFAKVRGKNQAIQKMLDELKSACENTLVNVGIPHANAELEAIELAKKIKEIKNVKEILINEVSPALSVHSGPGLLGLTFMPVEN